MNCAAWIFLLVLHNRSTAVGSYAYNEDVAELLAHGIKAERIRRP